MRTTRRLAAVVVGLVLLGVASFVRADAGCVDYRRLPHQVGQLTMPGPSLGVAMAGHYAYVASYEAGFQVVDVSDPAHPVTVGSVDTPGAAQDVAVSGSYAYVADGRAGGLQIIDISDPAHPFIAGSLLTPGSVVSVSISGHFAYLAAFRACDGLVIVDISDPTSPQLASGSGACGAYAYDVAVAGHFAYLADENHGLVVFDVSDPYAPVIAGSLGTEQEYYGVAVAVVGDIVYLGTWYESRWYVIDVADPANLAIVNTLVVGADHFAIEGSWAYVGDYAKGVLVYDIANPREPLPAGYAPIPDNARDVAVLDDIVCVAAEEHGLVLADVAERSSPAATGHGEFPGNTGGNLAVTGDIAIVTNGRETSCSIFDVADPAAPRLLDTVALPQYPNVVTIAGTLAYVADCENLIVIDIADPTDAQVVGSGGLAHGCASRIIVRDGYAWVANVLFGLKVFSLTDPRHPVLVSELALSHGPRDLALSGSMAYLPDDMGELSVVDISDPAAPNLVGNIALAWYADSVAIEDNLAYVACENFGLAVVDITDPTHPIAITYMTTPFYCVSVSIVGDVAYLVDDHAGLLVADLTDPRAPRLVSGLPFDNIGRAVESKGYLFVTAWEQGLLVYPAQCQYVDGSGDPGPAFAGLRLSAYPNPTSREMSVSFATSRGGPVQGDIFDVAGRLVRRLPPIEAAGGPHRLEWDGRDDGGRMAPAGVYLVRVTSPDGVATTRVAKVR
jgi:hypothetical protein